MSPVKLFAHGLAGCRLVEGNGSYLLADGSPTRAVAVTVSLLHAEPCLSRLLGAAPISMELAKVQGYRIAHSYDDAVASGLA
jgi:hypothetical protein